MGNCPEQSARAPLSRYNGLIQSASCSCCHRSCSHGHRFSGDRKKGRGMLLEEMLDQIHPLSVSFDAAAQRHLDSLTKPQGSLGRLEELARRVAVIQETIPPRLGAKLIFVFAADHGITEERVSAYPKAVTAQMTQNFLDGGAAINVLARHYDVATEVVDVGVDHEFVAAHGLRDCKVRRGTANFARGPAMTSAEALRS